MEAIVRAPNVPPDYAFSLDAWVTGSPVVTDAADPNATPPDATRVITPSRLAPYTVAQLGSGTIRAICADGTSLSYQPWFYDTTLGGIWVKYGTTSTITVATSNVSSRGVQSYNGMKFYVQITAVNGVTAFGYGFV